MVSEKQSSPPFSESLFCKRLSIAGKRHGVQVVVFSPEHVTGLLNQLDGYTYARGQWVHGSSRLPDIIYDRMNYKNAKHVHRTREYLAAMHGRTPLHYLARGLSGKWTVYQCLNRLSMLSPHLPETVKFKHTSQLQSRLRRHPQGVFLKPHSGTHGKRTLRVLRDGSESIRVDGRDPNNVPFQRRFADLSSAEEFLDTFIGDRSYILQPYLELSNTDQQPFDIRVLMQKNDQGRWTLTGMAARIGESGSITSNLHGGGTATGASEYLAKEFGSHTASTLIAKLTELSAHIPEQLESHFGRLAELGIDFGIDRDAQLWIIEVNSKPGRSAFFQIGDLKCAQQSVDNPVVYARYLWLRQFRRVTT
nr:YheC/YheD family protein [Paenibacillus shirakamiensis]